MTATLYETDYYLWARRQAKALRQLHEERWSGPLDLRELALEVDDLAKRDRNKCRSGVVRILVHLLKLDHSPATDPRGDWKASIVAARRDLRDDATPTLRRDLKAYFQRLYRDAREEAAVALERYGEDQASAPLPVEPRYSMDDVLRAGVYGRGDDPGRFA